MTDNPYFFRRNRDLGTISFERAPRITQKRTDDTAHINEAGSPTVPQAPPPPRARVFGMWATTRPRRAASAPPWAAAARPPGIPGATAAARRLACLLRWPVDDWICAELRGVHEDAAAAVEPASVGKVGAVGVHLANGVPVELPPRRGFPAVVSRDGALQLGSAWRHEPPLLDHVLVHMLDAAVVVDGGCVAVLATPDVELAVEEVCVAHLRPRHGHVRQEAVQRGSEPDVLEDRVLQ
eukprot:scaffold18951_cov63-Phaeocystis_antarctica.AAC.9